MTTHTINTHDLNQDLKLSLLLFCSGVITQPKAIRALILSGYLRIMDRRVKGKIAVVTTGKAKAYLRAIGM